jgi:hypothetical protein
MSGAVNKSRISQRLPLHKPDRDLWPGIEAGMAASDGVSLADKLPVRKAKPTAWNHISKYLPLPWYSYRKPQNKAALAGILMLLFFIFWYGYQKENIAIQSQKEPTLVEQKVEHKSKDSEGSSLKPTSSISEVRKATSQRINKNLNSGDIKMQTAPVPSIKKSRQVWQNQSFDEHTTAEQDTYKRMAVQSNMPVEKTAPDLPQALSTLQSRHINNLPLNAKNPEARAGLAGNYQFLHHNQNELGYESGLFVQPSFIRNISTIDQDWYFSKSVGVSMSLLSKDFIFETGLSYSEMEIEDKINWDYYAFVFVGTLINTSNFEWQEVVTELGDTIMQRVYIVTIVDIYDSVFVAEEQHDRIKFSSLNIPLSLGYRFRDNGNLYFDIKAGLDLMIVTGKIIPAKKGNKIDIKYLEYQNSLAEKNSVKWKYHLALGAGMRIGKNMSIYAEPTLWWYPEGVRIEETEQSQNPFEAGVKLGVKWRW